MKIQSALSGAVLCITLEEEIVKTGGNSVTIVNYGPWEDASDELWVMSDSQWHIPRSTVEYVVKTARELGLRVGYI